MAVTELPFLTQESRTRYLEKRRADLAICEAALTNQEFVVIEQLAHRMKGNGATFGFPDVSRVGALVEEAARAADAARVRASLSELASVLVK